MMNYEIWRLQLLISVCSVVEIEPLLQEISNEQLSKGADNTADARLDIHAGGFWEKQRSAFFYARVCFPNPDMYKDLELSYIYKIHEDKKKRKYAERVNEILHGMFNPLNLSSQVPEEWVKNARSITTGSLSWLLIRKENNITLQ